ncbi:MAG: hypothetical protein GY754_37860, partial [bacterium]|nr:hypothetical protein [bacterium]
NDRTTALSSLQGTIENDRTTALSSLQGTIENDRTTALSSLQGTIENDRATALNTASNNLIDNEIKRAAPPGTIAPFAGTNIPDGWLLCDGGAYGRTAYSELFQAIGTAWGTPDGSSFNVPDLRGIFLRGVDRGTGKDPDASARGAINSGGNAGNNVGSYQVDEFENHFHYMELYWGGWGDAPNFNHWVHPGDYTRGAGGRNSNSAGGSTETRPKNAYVNYIIKY